MGKNGIFINVSDATYGAIQKIAKENDWSLAQTCRKIILQFLQTGKKLS